MKVLLLSTEFREVLAQSVDRNTSLGELQSDYKRAVRHHSTCAPMLGFNLGTGNLVVSSGVGLDRANILSYYYAFLVES